MEIEAIRALMNQVYEALAEANRVHALLQDALEQPTVAAITAVDPAKASYRWSALGTDWAQIGGRGFIAAPKEMFASAAYKARYVPGVDRTVYVAMCTGLKTLSKALSVPLGKVSSCGGARLLDRLGELSNDCYGSVFMQGDERVHEMGWDDWDALHLLPKVGPAAGGPVTVTGRALTVRLPATMTAQQFDAAFDHYVGIGAVAPWLWESEGMRHCSLVGFDPDMARRFTAYRYDATSRLAPVREIAVFRPRSDADRLIEIIEWIILRHLGIVE